MTEKSPAFQFYPKDFLSDEPKHPHSACLINAVDAIIWLRSLTHEEKGILFNEIITNLLSGGFKNVQKYPFIVKTFKGHQKRKSLPPSLKRRVLSLGYCVFCNSNKNLTVDHIKPVSKGGGDSIKNLQCLCARCNRHKGTTNNYEYLKLKPWENHEVV